MSYLEEKVWVKSSLSTRAMLMSRRTIKQLRRAGYKVIELEGVQNGNTKENEKKVIQKEPSNEEKKNDYRSDEYERAVKEGIIREPNRP